MIKNLVYLSIFTTFVVLVWISLTIYHALSSTTITKDVGTQITPLKPTFNTSVISNLQARKQITVDLDSNLSTLSAVTPAPNASPAVAPIITPAGIPPVQTGTTSGGLNPGTLGGPTQNF